MAANASTAWSVAVNQSLHLVVIDPFEDQLETITRETRYFYVFTLVFSALFVFGIAFNLLSIFSILNSKSFTPINTLILSLAFSDIAYTMSIPLFAAHLFAKSWPFGELGCRVFYLVDMIGMNVSVLTITALSIERFIDVTSKLKNWKLFTQKSKLRAIILYICLSWLFSFIFAYPFVSSVRLVNFNNVYTCGSTWNEQTTRSYFTLKLVTSFVIPYVLITISSSKLLIFLHGWRNGASMTASSSYSVISTEAATCTTIRNTSLAYQSTGPVVSRTEPFVSQVTNEKQEETKFQSLTRGRLSERTGSSRFGASAKYQKHVAPSRLHKSSSLVNRLSRLGVENSLKKSSLTPTMTTDPGSEVSSQNLTSVSHLSQGSSTAFSNDPNSLVQLESPTCEERPMIELPKPRPYDSIQFVARPPTTTTPGTDGIRRSPVLQIKAKTDLALTRPPNSAKFFNATKKRSQTLANFALRRASIPFIMPRRPSSKRPPHLSSLFLY